MSPDPDVPRGCPECGEYNVEELPRSVRGLRGDTHVCTVCDYSWDARTSGVFTDP